MGPAVRRQLLGGVRLCRDDAFFGWLDSYCRWVFVGAALPHLV